MSKTSTQVEWRQLEWKTIEQTVYKLQKRIYEASTRDDYPTIHKLQKLLLKSWSARCLAVRRVTQDNRGKRTAGVDGVKNLTPVQRLALAASLRVGTTARPLRRVYIPKPGTTEQRPLGILTMRDRALQTLVKLALEPEWEARFEPNSYGFRPGRSCWDALEAIYTCINHSPKFVLNADVEKCFDRMNHHALLSKLHTFPSLRCQLSAWLKAGVVDQGVLFPRDAGAPQGGPLSPLLMNVALHGLEAALHAAFPVRRRYFHNAQGRYTMERTRLPVNVIRYADNLVVLHSDVTVIRQCQELLTPWLQVLGLQLHPGKTQITHTLHLYEGTVGFDFLGFHIRQYAVSKRKSAQGYKTLTKPSMEAIHRHVVHLRTLVRAHKSQPQEALITHLNPVIRGWSQYYSTAVSSDTFRKLDYILFHQLWAWAKRSNPHYRAKRISRKYWKTEGQRHWVFKAPTGTRLYSHAATKIRRFVKVQGTKSPFDGDLIYWASRLGHHLECTRTVASLLRAQRGRCAWCGLYFKSDDLWEVDHIIPTSHGGRDSYDNRQLLHGHCHDQKTAQDLGASEACMTPS